MTTMARYPQTILGTCCVPWNEDGTLTEDIFRASIRCLLGHGIRDLYVFGTAGEGYAVSDSMFDRIVSVFREEMAARDAEPMVGVVSLSLLTIIERIERAATMGVRLFQVSLPAWGAVSDKELFTFFREVCGRFPELQFLHYNLPRTKRLVTPDEYALLAQEHPNLVATKNGTSDLVMISGLLQKAGQLRHFITELGFAHGSLIGECGLLVSMAISNPRRAREYFQAGVNRDVEKLMALQGEIAELSAELKAAVGDTAHMDGAFDKIFSKILDPRFPLRLLPPYQGATDEAFERYRSFLRRRFPSWIEE